MVEKYFIRRKNQENFSVDDFHAILSANDGPITYSKQEKDVDILEYKRSDFGNFVAFPVSKKSLSLTGELSDKLIKDLGNYNLDFY